MSKKLLEHKNAALIKNCATLTYKKKMDKKTYMLGLQFIFKLSIALIIG